MPHPEYPPSARILVSELFSCSHGYWCHAWILVSARILVSELFSCSHRPTDIGVRAFFLLARILVSELFSCSHRPAQARILVSEHGYWHGYWCQSFFLARIA